MSGYVLSRLPGLGQPLGGAPIIARVANVFSTGEPIERGTHRAPVDIYTMAHMATGSILGFGRAPWWAIVALAAGFGGLGYLVQRKWPSPEGITMQNVACDAAAMILGWGMAKAWIETRIDMAPGEEVEASEEPVSPVIG